MLPFLLPNSVFCSQATARRASTSLRVLPSGAIVRRKTLSRPNHARLASSAAEEYEDDEGDDEVIESGVSGSQAQGEHVRWLLTQGAEFRRPRPDGPNWLGGTVPFPMNPSFKPPPPISDAVKTQIFNAYMTKGKNEVELGKAYGLSVSRVKAILRLKKLEQLWQKGKICQYRFQMDMEGHLGVPSSSTKISKERDQANNIDIDVDTFAIGQSKRLQRVFYEVVPEGEQPPLAQYMDLEEAMREEARSQEDEKRLTSKAEGMNHIAVAPVSLKGPNGKPFKSASRYRWFYPAKVGRPPYTFVDVGHRYLRSSDLAKEERKEKELREQQQLALRQGQLKEAMQAHKLHRQIRTLKQSLPKSERVRFKRRESAELELAQARSKVEKVVVTL